MTLYLPALCLPAHFPAGTHRVSLSHDFCAPTIANPRNITRDQIPGSHFNVKHLILSSQPKASHEQSKKEPHQTSLLNTSRDISLVPTRQEVEAEKQAALNKGTAVPSFLEVKLRVREEPGVRVHTQREYLSPKAFISAACETEPL